MNYRQVGHSGVRVSTVALGSWLTYGHSVEDDIAARTILTAYDSGINFFDTADVYNHHEAEIMLGDVLGEVPRTDLFIASKVYFPIGEGPNDRGLSRKHIFESLEASLTSLDMDYLDLYQCHRYDEETPLEETVRAMSDLISQGVVHYWGVSMWSADQIRAACRIADQINGYRPVSNQPRYNLLKREIETNGVQQMCEDQGLGIIAFSPLAEGILTGKYADGSIPPDSRAAHKGINRFVRRWITDENIQKSARLVELAESLETTPAVLSLAWLLRQPAMSSVIVGASKPAQVEENVQAADLEIPDDILQQLDVIFPA